VALGGCVLAVAEALDAVATKRGNIEAQVEATSLHLDQVLDDIDHGLAFAPDKRRQSSYELGIR
jgi:hypothetical protein